jgi:transposase
MMCRVKELDGRKLKHKALEEIRMRAVKQVVAGESPETVIKALGFTRCCIYNLISKYEKGGWGALKAVPLTGRTPLLNGKQLQKLYSMITEKTPTQLNFEFALWTRSMVGELIRKKFKVTLNDTTVGRVLRKSGLSPQKPLRRAYQRDKETVEVWHEEGLPGNQARGQEREGRIFCS